MITYGTVQFSLVDTLMCLLILWKSLTLIPMKTSRPILRAIIQEFSWAWFEKYQLGFTYPFASIHLFSRHSSVRNLSCSLLMELTSLQTQASCDGFLNNFLQTFEWLSPLLPVRPHTAARYLLLGYGSHFVLILSFFFFSLFLFFFFFCFSFFLKKRVVDGPVFLSSHYRLRSSGILLKAILPWSDLLHKEKKEGKKERRKGEREDKNKKTLTTATTTSITTKFGKRLTPDQLSEIMASAQSENPLFLKTMCNEFRIFGNYSALNDTIKAYTQAKYWNTTIFFFFFFFFSFKTNHLWLFLFISKNFKRALVIDLWKMGKWLLFSMENSSARYTDIDCTISCRLERRRNSRNSWCSFNLLVSFVSCNAGSYSAFLLPLDPS